MRYWHNLCSSICPNLNWDCSRIHENSHSIMSCLKLPVLFSTPLSWVMGVPHQGQNSKPQQQTLLTSVLPYIFSHLLCTPLSISLLVQPSQIAWAMISNFYHYVSSLHNSCPSFFLTVPWREHERGIPPCSNKTQRVCLLWREWKKTFCIFNYQTIGWFIIDEGMIIGAGLPLTRQGNEMVWKVLGH